jgi:phosphatidylglycerophosphate synthase
MTTKPWDARLAAKLVEPLRYTALQPNYLTTLRLVVGVAGALMFASGRHANLAALLIVASNFLDHTDGEFARMTGRHSHLGHYYDLAADATVTISMFIGIGIGLYDTHTASYTITYGVIAGIAVAVMFYVRQKLEAQLGKQVSRQPQIVGFEAEDILYLIPLVTLTDMLGELLIAAAVGAPVALIAVLIHYRLHMQDADSSSGQ